MIGFDSFYRTEMMLHDFLGSPLAFERVDFRSLRISLSLALPYGNRATIVDRTSSRRVLFTMKGLDTCRWDATRSRRSTSTEHLKTFVYCAAILESEYVELGEIRRRLSEVMRLL